MAQPARQTDPVYDNNNSGQPIIGPDLQALEGGGETSAPRSGHLSPVPEAGDAGGAQGSPGPKSPNDIKSLEESAGRDSVGDSGETNPKSEQGGNAGNESGQKDDKFVFNPHNLADRGNIRKVLRAAGGNRKKALIIGSGAASIISSIIVAFLIFLPLKIEHIVTNLQSRFFATSENAVANEIENMLSKYIKSHVIPSLTQCGSTIHKNCNVNIGNSNNPVEALMRGWRDAHLENKLATKYGIEFYAVKSGAQTKYFMKAPGLNPGGLDISSHRMDGGNLFTEISRSDARQQARQSVRLAMENETRWKRVMYRYKVGRLLEQKYGIKRCLIFCGTKDAITEFKAKKVNVAQMFIAQRVITPHTETLGIIMQCLFNPDCHPTQTSPQPATSGDNATLNGAPENKDVDIATRQKLTELAAKYGITSAADIDQMIKDYKNLSEGGYQKYIIGKTMDKIGLNALTDKVTGAIPVVGIVTTASSAVAKLQDIGPAVKKLSYVAGIGSAIQLFSMYRTYADELHTGNIDANQLGDFTKSLGPGNNGSPNDPEVGGTASAEQTPLYNSLVNHNPPLGSQVSLLNGISAFAAASKASAQSSNYVCKNGKPVPADKLVCSEEEIGKGNRIANSITSMSNKGILGIISGAAVAITNAKNSLTPGFVGDIVGFLTNALSAVTGPLTAFVSNVLSPFFKQVTNDVINNPFSTNMSGGRKVDLAAAGADGAGNGFCQTGLGCKKIGNKLVADIVNQQQNDAKQAFQHQSFFARMFSTDSQYSLITQVAMATPLSLQASAETNFASLVSNPLGALTHSFSSIFSGKASALFTIPSDDPFGVTQYGYDNIPSDPQTYWDQNCSDNAGQAYQNDANFNNPLLNWNKQAADPANVDPNNGMPTNTTANPCMLIKASVGSAGGIYDSSLLTPDDLAIGTNPGSSSSSSSSPAPTSTPTPAPTSCPSNGYFTTCGNRINGPNGEFIPYGISVIADLEGIFWQDNPSNNQGNNSAATDAQIQAAAQYWHSNTIRLQVSEGNFQDNPTPGKGYNDKAMQRLGAEVDAIEALGKIPMINDNTEFTDNQQRGPTTRTLDFWKNVTAYFASKDSAKYANIIFDIYNEPQTNGVSWQKGMQGVVDQIRNGSNLKNNLIVVQGEGPNYATSIDRLDQFPITGSNLAFAFHHVDLNNPSSWDQDLGLKLKTKVPVVDGEWAQYASDRTECHDQAPQNIQAYFTKLRSNHIGMLFWSLEPGVGVQLSGQQHNPVSDIIQPSFPVTASGYSKPTTFHGKYECKVNSDMSLKGQGAGAEVMAYFQKYGS